MINTLTVPLKNKKQKQPNSHWPDLSYVPIPEGNVEAGGLNVLKGRPKSWSIPEIKHLI